MQARLDDNLVYLDGVVQARRDAIRVHFSKGGTYRTDPIAGVPRLTKIMRAYFEATAEISTFTPMQYERLSLWLFEDVVLARGLAGRDVLLPMYRRAMAIIDEQDAAALEHWRRQVLWDQPGLGALFRFTSKRLEALLVSLRVQSGSQDWQLATESLHLLLVSRLTRDKLVNADADPDEDLPVIAPEELMFQGYALSAQPNRRT